MSRLHGSRVNHDPSTEELGDRPGSMSSCQLFQASEQKTSTSAEKPNRGIVHYHSGKVHRPMLWQNRSGVGRCHPSTHQAGRDTADPSKGKVATEVVSCTCAIYCAPESLHVSLLTEHDGRYCSPTRAHEDRLPRGGGMMGDDSPDRAL